jgi:hypothetical protein
MREGDSADMGQDVFSVTFLSVAYPPGACGGEERERLPTVPPLEEFLLHCEEGKVATERRVMHRVRPKIRFEEISQLPHRLPQRHAIAMRK